jgi:hypothetical protein
VVEGSTTNLIYQPQADSWDGHQFVGRNAVGIQPAGQPLPVYGVVNLKAITLVDKTQGTVALENIEVSGGDFPSAGAKAQEYVELARKSFPKRLEGLSLDYLEATMQVPAQPPAGSRPALKNTPPNIIVSTKPAILVSVDGPPAYRPVPGTELERVINSRMLLLRDKTGQHYLHVRTGYLTSSKLEGPWTVASQPPPGAAEAEKAGLAAPVPVDLMEAQSESTTNQPPPLTQGNAPMIYVATTGTELLTFEGQPDFLPITGTHLLYAANTTGNVFKSLSDQHTYVLLSGRWFRAPSLDGPWEYVPAHQLPAGFASIPDNSPKENVKASVPGTPQATEALIANSIPQSTRVARNAQMQPPVFDGSPQLQPIAGTPLSYVVNSSTPILKVDDRSWYACENGVWFASTSVNGPWTVAASVPAVIYSIPPDSPMHYLTYVHVYGGSPDYVYDGYTPGYMGTEVQDGVVVYGTGYYYAPWVGTVWYGAPYTWGWGWGPCWTPWYGWSFTIGFGWGWWYGPWGWWGCYPPYPYWGACGCWHSHGGFVVVHGPHSTFSTATSVYARPGTRNSVTAKGTGTRQQAASYGQAYNSRTGALAAGQRAGVQNVFNRPAQPAMASRQSITHGMAGERGAARLSGPGASRQGWSYYDGRGYGRSYGPAAGYWGRGSAYYPGTFGPGHSGVGPAPGAGGYGGGGGHGAAGAPAGGGGGGHGGGGGGGGHGGGGVSR